MRIITLLVVSAFYTTVRAEYCIPTSTYGTTDNDYIDGVELNTLVNTGSGGGDGTGYTDFTGLSTQLFPGMSYTISLHNTPSYSEYYRAWIDYDQNEIFEEDEELFSSFVLPAGESGTAEFIVPFTASPGATRMRVRCVYGTSDFDACSHETYGEAEDYTIIISGFDNDLGVMNIVLPGDDCELGNDEPVTIAIRNWGTETLSMFSVNYRADGGAVITEIFTGEIESLETLPHTFSTGADLSTDGTHIIEAWTSLEGDEYSANDSLDNSVVNLYTELTTGFPPLVCYSGETIFPSPLAGGGTWSGDGIIDAETGELDPSLIGGIGGTTEITYVFTADDGYTVTEIPYFPSILVDPEILALGDDEVEDNIAIGFDFEFFGNIYNDLFISSNGIIGFNTGDDTYTTQHLPDPEEPNNLIALCWTDLNPAEGGDIYYELQGVAPNRKFIVAWDEVEHYGGDGDIISGQIILYEGSNAIDLVAIQIESDGEDMTQGIENNGGTQAFLASESYNREPFSMSGKTWRYALTPCSGSVTETISIIDPPTVDLGPDISVCEDVDVILDAGPGAEYYAWNNGSDEQMIFANISGIYWVIYTVGPGCYAMDSINVAVNPNPVVDLGEDSEVCEGFILNAGNPGFEFDWNTTETAQVIYPDETGEYWVIVTNPATGCSGSDTVNYTVTNFPDATFEYENIGGLTVNFYNTTPDAETFLWNFGDGSLSFDENPVHTYPYADTWEVSLTVTNHCGADNSDAPIQISVGMNELAQNTLNIFPNPCTEYFMLSGIEGLSVLKIYSITGRLMYSDPDYREGEIIHCREFIPGNYYLTVQNDSRTQGVILNIAR